MSSKYSKYFMFMILLINEILICFVFVGAQKSASKFALDDIDSRVSKKVVKKETSKPLTIPEPKPVSTR
jgi:hypothetical protein